MKSKFILLFALLLFPLGKGTFSQTDVNNAQAIFIYNFLSHIKWPDQATSNGYTIGVFGNTSTAKYLETYTQNRKVGSKPIKVVQYQSVDEINNCQVLFIAYGKTNHISSINNKLKSQPCLIIGEREEAIQAGYYPFQVCKP